MDKDPQPVAIDTIPPGSAGEMSQERTALLFMLEDLEWSRHQIEQAHREWVAALDTVSALIFMHDKEFRILRCNRAYQQCAGIPYKEIIGQLYYEIFPKSESPLRGCLRAMEKAEEEVEEVTVGEAIYLSRAFSIRDEQGVYLYSVHTFEDITERKQAEEMLSASYDLLQSVVENTPVRVFWKDTELRYLGCNTAFARDAGMSRPEDLIGKDDFQMGWREQAELYRADDKRVMDSVMPNLGYEEPQTTPDGRTIWLRTSKVPLRGTDGKVFGMLGIYEDITDRKQAEIALVHANRAIATLGAVNRQLVHATDENELLQAICQAIVEQRGYRMAWVGYAQQDTEKTIKIMAHAGYEEGYLDTMQLTWVESERGMGPSGRAIRSGATQLCQDIASDPQFSPWRDAAVQRGYLASIALPLSNVSGEVFGILNVYAEEVNAFRPNEVELLEEMAGDLAFGVRTLHMRQERDRALEKNQQHLVQLQDRLEDTVRAIATISEMRDPYTSGHQVRVADLATAIATQMGLPVEQVHAIHLAGVMHDLGKIQIPAEILSKPGRITDIEYSLIKIHPQAGYDILKGIDFPWPIAQMVLQHHERLDGTGYPQGLKGDAILLEARILCVADVVEAMSSHRPYRPGLGVEVALAEIIKQCGIYFDPAVVDACLAVFREQRYAFKN